MSEPQRNKPLVSSSEAWQQLQQHATEMASQKPLSVLFEQNPERFQQHSIQLGSLLFDYSKQRVTTETLKQLMALARQQQLPEKIQQLLQGASLNQTEGRAALHTALRSPADAKIIVDGRNVVTDVHQVRQQMTTFVERVREGVWRGFTGKRITDVVNIGVGGSDLGPKMICRALRPGYGEKEPIRVHFISSIDGAHAADILPRLSPETTLFVVSSKTFTTTDTLANAAAAREWLAQASQHPRAVAQHFVAATADPQQAERWGVPQENVFPFWEWVGGRYSMWSSIGLTIALYLGMERFDALLQGAQQIDQHFSEAPLEQNIPVLMGLIGVWNSNFLGMPGQVVLPYAAHLSHLSNYLEQLEMESLGKSVTQQGGVVDYDTGPIIWGGVGSNAQHAFYQLLHQGTRFAPMDFILPIDPAGAEAVQYQLTIANCLAQSRAFMVGQQSEDPHRLHPGNRPSSTLLLDALTPHTLGMVVALYEHKVFVQSVIWEINPFDQFGVELGKKIATQLHQHLIGEGEAGEYDGYDSSTRGLLQRIEQRGKQR